MVKSSHPNQKANNDFYWNLLEGLKKFEKWYTKCVKQQDK